MFRSSSVFFIRASHFAVLEKYYIIIIAEIVWL